MTTQAEHLEVQRVKRISTVLTGLLISLVTIIIILGAVELTGYLWEKKTAQGKLGWTLVASRRLHLVLHGTEERPYYLFRPNEDYFWEGIPVHINARGFRTDEFAVPKPTNTVRILNIGDSVAFGWEVRQEGTYGKQLEQILNQQANGKQYEVINAGIPGWTIEAERNFLLQEGLDYQPDLVILDITIVNDIYGSGPAVSEDPSLFQWLRDHTYSWPFLTTQARFLLAKQRGPEAIPVLNPPRNADAYFPIDENHPVWDKIWKLIAEMKQACDNRDIDFLIVTFPTAFQVNSSAHPDTPQHVLGEKASLSGTEILDLTPTYAQACKEAGASSCDGFENLLFADVWMHPNSLGHKIAAEQISYLVTSIR